MGRKTKNKKKGLGAEKTAMKTDKKIVAKQKRMLEKIGEEDIVDVLAKIEAEELKSKTIYEEIVGPPSPRSNASFVSNPEKDEIYLFGGEYYNGHRVFIYNDFFIYNITRREWKQLHSPGGPTPRSSHQMVYVASDGGQLWMFGGEYASPSQLQFFHYKDLWVLRLKNHQWEKINCMNGPSARSGHRMVHSKKRLFIFGGFYDNNKSSTYFNDIHIFCMDNYEWLKVEITMAPPKPRSGCCMAAHSDGRIYVWGGYSKNQSKKNVENGVTHTDVFVLTPDNKNTTLFKWSSIKTKGFKPSPRSGVSTAVSPTGLVMCFGGVLDIEESEEELTGQFSNELVSFDLSLNLWSYIEYRTPKQVKKSNNFPILDKDENDTEMSDISVEPIHSKPLVTTDGVFTITVAGPSNSNPETSKMPGLVPNKASIFKPCPRMSALLCISKGVLYLFGGICEDNKRQITMNDFYCLDVHKLDEWKVLIPFNKNDSDWVGTDSSDSEDSDDSDENSDTDDSSESDSSDDSDKKVSKNTDSKFMDTD